MIASFQNLPATPCVGLPVRSSLSASPPPVRRPTRPQSARKSHSSSGEPAKTCLHCGSPYTDSENGPLACHFHGHMTGNACTCPAIVSDSLFLGLREQGLQNCVFVAIGDRGLHSFAPPHQGMDGEWTDDSGIIVYKWNSEGNRPNTGSSNWKRRWTCCGVYEEDARPCRRGWHVCYDDEATRY